MPGGDGTGPQGKGRGTGKGQGPCKGGAGRNTGSGAGSPVLSGPGGRDRVALAGRGCGEAQVQTSREGATDLETVPHEMWRLVPGALK
jgi:hypothetical protein